MSNLKYTEDVCSRIEGYDSEAVFILNDFSDIADINTIRQIFMRLEQTGKIRRILAGIYYNPTYSELLGEYEAPSPHNVAMAIARKLNWTIAPSGNTALNQLGLSTQVSAKWSYISDGPYRNYEFGNVEIEFKRKNNKEISNMSYKSATVIQALKALKKENVSETVIEKLRSVLTSQEKEELLKDGQKTTVWVYDVIKKVCKEDR